MQEMQETGFNPWVRQIPNISWTEEPGRLQSMGLDTTEQPSTHIHTHTHTHTYRNWLTLGPRTSNGRTGIQGRQSHIWTHAPKHLLANTQNYVFQEMCWEEYSALILMACIPTPQHCIIPSSQESHRDLKMVHDGFLLITLLLIIPQLAISQRTLTSTTLCPSSCTKETDLSEHTSASLCNALFVLSFPSASSSPGQLHTQWSLNIPCISAPLCLCVCWSPGLESPPFLQPQN